MVLSCVSSSLSALFSARGTCDTEAAGVWFDLEHHAAKNKESKLIFRQFR